MGLFDGQKTDYYQRLAGRIAPIVEEKTGYVSPDRKLRRQVAGTDLSDSNAVQKTFQMLMQRDPRDAAAWLKKVQPMVEMHREQQKLQASSTGGLGKQLDLQGKVNNARAAQFVQQAGRPKNINELNTLLTAMANQGLANTAVYRNLESRLQSEQQTRATQPSISYATEVKKLVDDVIDFGITDFGGDVNLPSTLKGMSHDQLSNWVVTYSKAKGEDPSAVLDAILQGNLNPKAGIAHPDNTDMYEKIGYNGDIPTQRQQTQGTNPAGVGIAGRPKK